MPLKNKMEGKKLNLNRPLLSVRRRSSPLVTSQKNDKSKTVNSIPIVPWPSPYRSELQLGPIKNPGSVPFLWEHVPGRPKEDLKPHSQYDPKPPIAPKIPSGRYLIANQPDSPKVSQTTNGNKGKTVNAPQNTRNYSYSHERVRSMERRKETAKELVSSISEESNEACVDELDTETPHNPPKNKPVVREETKVRKMKNQVKPYLRYVPNFLNRYSHYDNGEEEKSDGEYDRSGNLLGVCGLLPPFCLKSSVGVLNPVPSMSTRSRVLMSRASNIKPRSSSSGSYNTENESKSDISDRQSFDKILAAEFEEKTSLRNESGQSHNTSTYRDTLLLEGEKHVGNNSFGSHGKRFRTFHEFMIYKGSLAELDLEGVLEKTLYVDTVHMVESPKSRSYSPYMQHSKGVHGSSDEDCEIITKRMDQMHVKDSSIEDFTKFDTVDKEAKMVPNAQEIDDFNIQSSNDKPNKKRQKFSDFPVPPPLPKSPSDSWLGRTLPSVSSKNRSYYSSRNLQNQLSKGNMGNLQWEAIVISTYAQSQHLRYTEEISKPKPET